MASVSRQPLSEYSGSKQLEKKSQKVVASSIQISGGKPEKVIGQYPFFQPDMGANQKYMKNARKATDAEWKLLARYKKTTKLVKDAHMDEDYQSRPGYKVAGKDLVTAYEERQEERVVINPRLHVERNYIDTESNIKIQGGTKRSIVDRVFAQEKAYTKVNKDHLDHVDELDDQFDASKNNKKQKVVVHMPLNQGQQMDDFRGPAIVPFFPSHWQENSNSIFNHDFMILDPSPGKKFQSPQRYDTLAHGITANLSTEQKSKAENERPTSGKHFSRISNHDMSSLTKNYTKTKHVDHLMKKLAEYMSQDGTEVDLSMLDMTSMGAQTELPQQKIIKRSPSKALTVVNEKKFKLKKQIQQEIQDEAKRLNELTYVLPDIESQQHSKISKSRTEKKMKVISKMVSPKQHETPFRIKRDFDTHLSEVSHPVNRHPFIHQRAANPDIELQRERIRLEENLVPSEQQEQFRRVVMSEKISKSIPKKQLSHKPLAQKLDHRAFWVQSTTQSQSTEPTRAATELKTTSDQITESYQDQPVKMELVQQYVLVRGKLQPALKYKAPQQYYNRYKVIGEQDNQFSEVITYPAVNGDVKVQRKHKAYVSELKNKKGWGEGVYESIRKTNLNQQQESLIKRHYSFDPNKDTRRGMNGDFYDSENEFNDLEDPRNIGDLERENIDLKEQMIHQMVTLEQYLSVAYLWFKDNPVSFDQSVQGDYEDANVENGQSEGNDGQSQWHNYDNKSLKSERDVTKSVRIKSSTKRSNVPRIASQFFDLSRKIKSFFFQRNSDAISYKPAEREVTEVDRQTVRTSKNNLKLDFKMKILMEVDRMKEQIKNYCGEYQIIDQENLLRDNKRKIVNSITENIYTLKNGFKDADNIVKSGDYVQKLIKMMLRREKKVQIIEQIYKNALARRDELTTWVSHSLAISMNMKVRICEDIVHLIQQKQLLNEFYARRFIKVGYIEEKLKYVPRPKNQWKLNKDNKDQYYNFLLLEVDEHERVYDILVRESESHLQLCGSMREFLNEVFGNAGWERLVHARWLKKRQINQDNDFDPDRQDVVPVFVKDGVQFKPKNQNLRESQEQSPQRGLELSPPPIPEPVIEMPQHEVEDPLNLLGASDDELEAEGTKKKKVLLTQVVLKEKEQQRQLDNPEIESQKSRTGDQTTKQVSKWLGVLKKERVEKKTKEEEEREARIARFKSLLDSDDSEDEKVDYGQMVGQNLQSYLQKVQSTVEAEQRLINVWREEKDAQVMQQSNQNSRKSKAASSIK